MMAEFTYFWTKQEMLDFLVAAFNEGFKIQVNKTTQSPVFIVFDSATAIEAAVANGEFNFVLTRADITRYPFKFRPIIRDGEELWYFRTRVGGPCVEVSFHEPYEQHGKSVVAGTYLAYHSKILHPETDQFEPAGDVVKKEFNALIAPLRKKSKKVKSIKCTAYVSPGVMGLLGSGYVLNTPFANIAPV
jgi:hypothetical protein